MRFGLTTAFILVTGCVWFVSPLNGAQRGPATDVKRPFRENVALPVDGNLLKRFGTAQDLLADERWNEAINLLQEIVQVESKSLVQVQPGRVGSVATYINVASYANLLLSRASVEGREVYRQKVDPQSRRWFENWQRTRDETELLRIVRQAFLSRSGDDALLALGEAAWDRGDFSAARLWWEHLIPLPADANPAEYPTVLRYPDTDLDVASILARIVLCSIHEAEYDRAQDELRQLVERYPLAEGWLCGKRGRLVELVRESLADSRHWKRVPAAAEVATFGMSPERYFRLPETVDVGALRWARPLPPNVLRPASERLPNFNEPLSYHPVVYEKIVLVNDSNQIRAWSILTGDPAWQSEHRDPAVIYPPGPDDPILSPDKPCVGAPHYTMTIAGGRLYARMGSPVTCSSTAELRREFPSDLVCLDLTQEGKLVWKFAAHELFPEDPPWRYEGTPVVVGGRAYVTLCRRHPQLELMVACLDASDGRLLWRRPIGAFRTSVDESHNRVSHLLLTVGGGRLFLSTDAGAIVAMDAVDGRLEWTITYESRPEEGPPALSDHYRKGLLPAMFHQGLLFVAPSDSTAAYCIEADSGRIHWQYSYLNQVPRDREANRLRVKQWRHLLGVVRGGPAGRLIVSGTSLLAIDVETGVAVWERGEGASFRGGEGAYGRGLIADDQIFIPLRESIEIYQAQTGQHLRQVLLKVPDSPQYGGNLTLAGGMLLVAQPNRLAAYCEYSRLKERIENELTLRPNDSQLWIQLAEVETAEGHFDAAVEGYRKVLAWIGQDEPDYFKVRRKLAKLLQEAGSAEFASKKPADAHDHWIQALEVTDDITKRVDLIFELGSAEEALDKPEKALQRLQEILSNERLGSVRRENLTAAHAASESMSRLIADFGRDAYAQIEADATLELEQLAKADDRGGLKRLIAKYPHASVATSARNLLVRLYRQSGEISEAYATLCEIERFASDDQTRVQTMLAKIELLQRSGMNGSARRLWQTVASSPLSMEVVFEGTKSDLQQLAREHLQRNESILRTRPSFLQRTWSLEISSDELVIVPNGDAPAAEFESLLICSKSPQHSETWLWRCLNWRTGKLRWKETASNPIRAAAWTDVHLLIGTPDGWQARSADSGRRVWDQVSLAESTPMVAGCDEGAGNHDLWPILFDVDRGLQLFDGNNGQLIANLKPAGNLHSVFGIHIESTNPDASGESASPADRQTKQPVAVMMQTTKPTRTWCATAVSPRGKWTFVEVAAAGELWKDAPVELEGKIIGLTSDNHLVGIGAHSPEHKSLDDADSIASQSRNRWDYSNFAMGLGPPMAFSFQNRLLVVVDGSRLVSFDPTRGTRQWSASLADFPLLLPRRQICAGNGRVFATSEGTLRAISATDGSIQMEQYLGDTTPQWRTTLAWKARAESETPATQTEAETGIRRGALIACWPIGSTNTKQHTIRLCDAETGVISQRLQFESEPREIAMNSDGFGIVWTNDRICAIQFASASTIANARPTLGASQP